MTIEKLLEFYNQLKNSEMNVSVLRKLRKCSTKEIELIMNNKYPQVIMDLVINYEFKLLKEKEQETIVNIINNAKNEKIAVGIYQITISSIILSSGLTTKIANIISESNENTASCVIDLALHPRFLINPNALEIMKIVGASEHEYQAKAIASVTQANELLLHKDALTIIKLISETKYESRCNLMAAIAKNRAVLSTDLVVKLSTLASKIDPEATELITVVASNKCLEKNYHSVNYITTMLECPENMETIYEYAQVEIRQIKLRETRAKTDENLFWNIYKKNPEEAIKLLKESDKTAVTAYTRVRKKQLD